MTAPKKRRWRKDCGDWVTGASPRTHTGTGGIVCSADGLLDGGWTADVYWGDYEIRSLYPRSGLPYRSLGAAQRAVERWFERRARKP